MLEITNGYDIEELREITKQAIETAVRNVLEMDERRQRTSRFDAECEAANLQ